MGYASGSPLDGGHVSHPSLARPPLTVAMQRRENNRRDGRSLLGVRRMVHEHSAYPHGRMRVYAGSTVPRTVRVARLSPLSVLRVLSGV